MTVRDAESSPSSLALVAVATIRGVSWLLLRPDPTEEVGAVPITGVTIVRPPTSATQQPAGRGPPALSMARWSQATRTIRKSSCSGRSSSTSGRRPGC